MRTAIVDTTGTILVLDPPTDADGAPILPEGVDYRVVELSDVEATKLETPSSRFTVNRSGVVIVEAVAAPVLTRTLADYRVEWPTATAARRQEILAIRLGIKDAEPA